MPRRRGYRRSDSKDLHEALRIIEEELFRLEREPIYDRLDVRNIKKPKRKLSAWNKYVKANSKKPRFRYRNGKLNLKKMAVAFRKTPAGRKKRR
jgi:hypothetical protein